MADQTGDGSWGKVVGITVAACLVVGALLWSIVPKGAPVAGSESSDPAEAAQNGQPQRSAAAQEARDAMARRDERPTKAERLEARLGKPPRLSVQISNPLAGTCPTTFSESIVVRVIRGDFDEIVAEVRIPKDKVTRTRTLMHSEGDWTATIGGLPVNRTATLLIMATGPRDEETVSKDITVHCGGGPIDKDDPYDLVGKDARTAIREKMFTSDYDFDFDYPGGSDKSGATQPKD